MIVPTALRGVSLIHDPRWNKGTAFTQAERDALGLQGLLPPRVLTMEEQLLRVRHNFEAKTSDIEKYIFLVSLQDRNETLFYRLVVDHLIEMLPIIYTPTVGEACRTFGHIFRRPRGLYLSVRDRGRVREVLQNWPDRDVAVIVATDGERILGLGDLGAHGMGIPIGKLAIYTACAGVPPFRCLPVTLDVGTDNAALREDPLYTGLRQPRVRGPEYDALIEEFVAGVRDLFPGALLQWEDFATDNAIRLLERYQDQVCSFNDDIQGTAAVVLSALLSACRVKGERLGDQRLLFLGAGASATGVASLIASAMRRDGLGEREARGRIWFFDSRGLVQSGRGDLAPHKRPYAHDHQPVSRFLEAVELLRPTGIIGLSTQGGAFDDRILEAMTKQNARPIVFALSNPTSSSECTAEAVYRVSGEQRSSPPEARFPRRRWTAASWFRGRPTTHTSSLAWAWGWCSAGRAASQRGCSTPPPASLPTRSPRRSWRAERCSPRSNGSVSSRSRSRPRWCGSRWRKDCPVWHCRITWPPGYGNGSTSPCIQTTFAPRVPRPAAARPLRDPGHPPASPRCAPRGPSWRRS